MHWAPGAAGRSAGRALANLEEDDATAVAGRRFPRQGLLCSLRRPGPARPPPVGGSERRFSLEPQTFRLCHPVHPANHGLQDLRRVGCTRDEGSRKN